MTGIGPHESSHAAVAIGAGQEPPGGVRVDAWPSRAGGLLAWAAGWPGRARAAAGAAGPGHLPARQLAAAGEQVLDVPPGLAARVRLLQAGDTSKNDPGDARPAAVAALRSAARRPVPAEDHAAVLKVWANRHPDLARARARAACRLHAVPAAWSPAVTRRRSPRPGPPASSGVSPRPARLPGPAASSPPGSSPASAAWTPGCAAPARSRPRRPGPRAPA